MMLTLTCCFLGLGKGDRTKLTVFIAQNKARLLRDYKRLTTVEKQAYNARILEARQAKRHTARANPKAIKHDVNAAFTSMDREVCFVTVVVLMAYSNYPQWMALHARTGIEGFYVAVRGGIEDLAEPKIFFTEKAQKFVQDVLGIEPQHLGLKLEAFVISKLGALFFSIIPYPTDSPKDERVLLNRQRPLNKLISECRELIQDELGTYPPVTVIFYCVTNINIRRIHFDGEGQVRQSQNELHKL
jgi:hypothetical protein